MKCPVCKTECGKNHTCEKCGLTEVGKELGNQEATERWLRETVVPYRNNYYISKGILPQINWLEVFMRNSQAKRLFTVSIPATVKKDFEKEENITSVLGHIAFVSTNKMIRDHFVDVLSEHYPYESHFTRVLSKSVKKDGILANILTILEPGDVLVFEMNSKLNADVVGLFCEAIHDFCLTVNVDEGMRKLLFPIAPFTTLFLANAIEDIPTDILNELDTVIEFNPSQDELNELLVREEANKFDIQLTEESLEIIREYYSRSTIKNIRRIMRFITDYMYIHPEFKQPLSVECVKNILEML